MEEESKGRLRSGGDTDFHRSRGVAVRFGASSLGWLTNDLDRSSLPAAGPVARAANPGLPPPRDRPPMACAHMNLTPQPYAFVSFTSTSRFAAIASSAAST